MFIQNKYTRWYESIISQAKNKVNGDYYVENHHIIPRCLGGSDDESNLVLLGAREHFICHLLLTKMSALNRNKLYFALHNMLAGNSHHRRYVPRSSYVYAIARKRFSEAMKGNTFTLGKTRSLETRQKASITMIERKRNVGPLNGMWGKTFVQSDETKKKISERLKSSSKLKESRSSVEFRKKISDIQSEETLLVSVKSGAIISSWKNCHELSKALDCTYANIKNARRDKRPVGKRIACLDEECYVIFRKDYA